MFRFNFTKQVLQNELDEAVLSLHLQELDNRNTTFDPEQPVTVTLQVSRITKNSQGSRASVPYPSNSVKLLRKELRAGKWVKIDLTTIAAEYCGLPRDSLAIVVRVQDSSNRTNLVVSHPSSETNNDLVSLRSARTIIVSAKERPLLNIGIFHKCLEQPILCLTAPSNLY